MANAAHCGGRSCICLGAPRPIDTPQMVSTIRLNYSMAIDTCRETRTKRGDKGRIMDCRVDIVLGNTPINNSNGLQSREGRPLWINKNGDNALCQPCPCLI